MTLTATAPSCFFHSTGLFFYDQARDESAAANHNGIFMKKIILFMFCMRMASIATISICESIAKEVL